MSDQDNAGQQNLSHDLGSEDDQEAAPAQEGEDPAAFSGVNTLISLSPTEELPWDVVQVSSTFYQGAGLDDSPPDIAILSMSYGILFAVHSHRILEASNNNFAGLVASTDGGASDPSTVQGLPTSSLVLTPERSDVLNIVLHSVYGLSCDTYHPSFDCICASLDAFARYGLTPLSKYLCRGTPLFDTFLCHAPLHPIQAYTIAASLHLEDVAVAASSYTLSLNLQRSISPEDADRMGELYLFRLYKLHTDRMVKLRAILQRTKLYPHIAKPGCSAEKRKNASFAYGLACAQVWHDASPAMSRVTIEEIMRRLYRTIDCPDCVKSVEELLDDICMQWLLLERTI